jgi:hypothetical protein
VANSLSDDRRSGREHEEGQKKGALLVCGSRGWRSSHGVIEEGREGTTGETRERRRREGRVVFSGKADRVRTCCEVEKNERACV